MEVTETSERYGRNGRYKNKKNSMYPTTMNITKRDNDILEQFVTEGIFFSKSEAIRHAIKLLVKDSILIGELVETPGNIISVGGLTYKLIKKKVGVNG